MNLFLKILMPLFIGQFAFATNIVCSVDKMDGSSPRQSVPVTVSTGAFGPAHVSELNFEGKKLSVVWNKGGSDETQTSLSMSYGNINSTQYDVRTQGQVGPLNVITEGMVRFQCAFEN